MTHRRHMLIGAAVCFLGCGLLWLLALARQGGGL